MGSGIDIGTLDPEVASTSYISGIEWPLPLQDKVTPPNGCEFDHWILRRAGAPDINPTTIIPETLDVNVEIIAVYNPLTYNITWDMGTGSDGGTLDPIVASASYTHGTSYSLPMSDKITPPVGREFDHWKLIKTGSGGADIEPATNIDKAVWGDITIKAVYNNLTFPITWILNGATIVEQNINSTIINNISTNTYYFDKYGNMLTGWVKTNPDNKWYFLENAKTIREGSMVFGWYKVQNDWYYFDKDGAMLVNTTTPDGYAIGSDGRWIQ